MKKLMDKSLSPPHKSQSMESKTLVSQRMTSHALLLLLPFLFFLLPTCVPYKVENGTEAMKFLSRFGYVEPEDMPSSLSSSEARPILAAYQIMCGLDITGELDNSTLKMMNTARCGNKDMMMVENDNDSSSSHSYASPTNRLKRYVLNQHKLKWTKREVTYKLATFSSEMHKHVKRDAVLAAIHEAFGLWSAVTNLDFFHTPKSKSVDIELSFTSRFHKEDGYPFDGPGSVLAHAFPPGNYPLAGDVHFEDEEDWRLHSPKGTDVLYVAVHEIGHALGLSHSTTKGAIMAPHYGGYRPKLKLHQDDIDGIQALYGKRSAKAPSKEVATTAAMTTTRRTTTTTTRRTTTTPRTTTTTTTPKTTRTTTTPKTTTIEDEDENSIIPAPTQRPSFFRPDLCADGWIDAITAIDGKIYVFKGSYVFQISPEGGGVLPGWPNHIGFTFPGVEASLDAVMTREENGKTYFFKGNKYWRFSGLKMDKGYPKEISRHFPGLPPNPDSAFAWFGQFYFTKGDKFWRFNPKLKPHVSYIYPLSMRTVWGISGPVQAALTAPNGKVYLFSGPLYYMLDPSSFRVAPGYPRPSRENWFGCRGAERKEGENSRELREYEDQDANEMDNQVD